MLDVALEFLREQLQAYVAVRAGAAPTEVKLTRLVDEAGKYAFPEDSLALTLVNVEEDRTFKDQLPTHTYVNGQHVVQEPELKLNLHVLAAANFRRYDEALKHLAHVLTFFQARATFAGDRYAGLDPRITKLTAELQSLGYEQLNQLWAFVGGKQLPSAVYKIRLVVLQDMELAEVRPPVTTISGTFGGLAPRERP